MKKDQLVKGSRQSLFHGTTVKGAYDILRSGTVQPRTEQVFGGNKLNGVSTSRDINFALDWGHIVLEFSTEKVKHHNKVVPVDFLHSSPHYNVERRHCSEEFIVGDLDVHRCLDTVYIKNTARQSDYYDDILDLLHEDYRSKESVEL